MRLSLFAFVAAAALALTAACGGGDEDASFTPPPPAGGASTPAPTATPFARVPEPIVVTGSATPDSPGATETGAEYVVEAGDSLAGISARFGVDADVIREANDIDGDDIFIGQTLLIPRGGTSPGEGTGTGSVPTPEVPNAGSGDTYVVEQGDTALGIALEFDVTVAALAAANGMTEDEITNLQIGQVINLPRPQ